MADALTNTYNFRARSLLVGWHTVGFLGGSYFGSRMESCVTAPYIFGPVIALLGYAKYFNSNAVV